MLAGGAPAPALAPERRRAAFVLMAGTFSLTGFISWGLPLQLVELLKHVRTSRGLCGLRRQPDGPGTGRVAPRRDDLRPIAVGILTVGLIATGLMPFAMLLPVFGPGSAPAAVAFVIAFGLSAGAMTVVRNVAPLALFGKDTYATMSGRLNLPLNVAFAMSPMVFAFLMRQAGPVATLLFAFGTALVALGIMAMLERRFGRDAVA
jgi:hypothetical protein